MATLQCPSCGDDETVETVNEWILWCRACGTNFSRAQEQEARTQDQ